MKARGMTQQEIAQRIGLTRPSYANIESGRQRIPVDVLWRAAIVLKVKLNDLMPEIEEAPARSGSGALLHLVRTVTPGTVLAHDRYKGTSTENAARSRFGRPVPEQLIRRKEKAEEAE